jgi:hypothetical protein
MPPRDARDLTRNDASMTAAVRYPPLRLSINRAGMRGVAQVHQWPHEHQGAVLASESAISAPSARKRVMAVCADWEQAL